MKAYAAACDRNKDAILEVLRRYLTQTEASSPQPLLLEVGSGTGQHSIYFSAALPQLQWQPSDRAEQLDDIRAWQRDMPQDNNLAPLELNLNQPLWPVESVDHIFTANTLHIVSLALVQRFIDGVKATLNPQGYLFIYGPFNYQGNYTSQSNAEFDIWLKQRDTSSGIRDFEFIHQALTASNCCTLIEDVQMPANNRMLVYQKNHKQDLHPMSDSLNDSLTSSLRNQLLIATPTLADGIFKSSVTYICEHNEEGAMGVMINRPSDLTIHDILEDIDTGSDVDFNAHPVMLGGPVGVERGFVLHQVASTEQEWTSTLFVTDQVALTGSKDILQAMGEGQGPENFLMVLGYAGWSAGQLEQELLDNAWLTSPATTEILFDTPYHLRAAKAARQLGVDLSALATQAGNA